MPFDFPMLPSHQSRDIFDDRNSLEEGWDRIPVDEMEMALMELMTPRYQRVDTQSGPYRYIGPGNRKTVSKEDAGAAGALMELMSRRDAEDRLTSREEAAQAILRRPATEGAGGMMRMGDRELPVLGVPGMDDLTHQDIATLQAGQALGDTTGAYMAGRGQDQFDLDAYARYQNYMNVNGTALKKEIIELADFEKELGYSGDDPDRKKELETKINATRQSITNRQEYHTFLEKLLASRGQPGGEGGPGGRPDGAIVDGRLRGY